MPAVGLDVPVHFQARLLGVSYQADNGGSARDIDVAVDAYGDIDQGPHSAGDERLLAQERTTSGLIHREPPHYPYVSGLQFGMEKPAIR